MSALIPPREKITVLFGHVAYQFAEPFEARKTGIRYVIARTPDEVRARIADTDVGVFSFFWKNELAAIAPRLKFLQSISAGTDQYDKPMLKSRGIRLASAQGVNANAVAEHAIATVLALSRQLHFLRDAQAKKHWRGMQGDRRIREDEIQGKVMLIVGLGRIGGRLAELAKAFGMTVIALRRDPASGAGAAHEVHSFRELHAHLPRADYVVLTCPLTPETEKLIGARELGLMKPAAHLVNVARGKVVDEPALIAALAAGKLAAAGLDCFVEEPLPADSPLWGFPNVIVTHHVGGETRAYEDNVVDILLDNLARLERGDPHLRNEVV